MKIHQTSERIPHWLDVGNRYAEYLIFGTNSWLGFEIEGCDIKIVHFGK